MKAFKNLFLITIILFLASSCVEIIDDITINNDGSGTLKYTVNLSSSKVKINSILALDSLDGHRVPKKEELEEKIQAIKKNLAEKSGITNVVVESNFVDYIFKIQCDFKSVNQLQEAFRSVAAEEPMFKNSKELNSEWVSWDGQKLKRSIPDIKIDKPASIKEEDMQRLKEGNYTSITRFQRAVDHFDNQKAILSKNQLAVMIKTTPYLLKENNNLIENTIYLVPLK